MARPSQFLSPRQLAEAIGVSESSVKRWADEGRIPLGRTAGGHRRIRLEEALRFVREARLELVRPELLGIGDLEPVRAGGPRRDGARLVALLREGRGEELRAALVGAYLAGESVAALCDDALGQGLREVGEPWREGPGGILREHRATASALSALLGLRHVLPPPAPGAPVALGGAVAGDPSHVPTAMAAAVLASEGFAAIDLGPETPAGTLLDAADEHRPALVWVAANHVEDARRVSREVGELAEGLRERRIPGLLGGAGVAELDLSPSQWLRPAGSMVELAAFARGLAQSGRATAGPPAAT